VKHCAAWTRTAQHLYSRRSSNATDECTGAHVFVTTAPDNRHCLSRPRGFIVYAHALRPRAGLAVPGNTRARVGSGQVGATAQVPRYKSPYPNNLPPYPSNLPPAPNHLSPDASGPMCDSASRDRSHCSGKEDGELDSFAEIMHGFVLWAVCRTMSGLAVLLATVATLLRLPQLTALVPGEVKERVYALLQSCEPHALGMHVRCHTRASPASASCPPCLLLAPCA
jgi:hypothetical protein